MYFGTIVWIFQVLDLESVMSTQYQHFVYKHRKQHMVTKYMMVEEEPAHGLVYG